MLNRRTLIVALSSLLVGARGLAMSTVKLAPWLNNVDYDRDAIGKRYLRCYRDEANVAVLRSMLPSFSLSAEGFNTLCRDDFSRENIVILDGWVLARSEARYCAYRYLTGSRNVT